METGLKLVGFYAIFSGYLGDTVPFFCCVVNIMSIFLFRHILYAGNFGYFNPEVLQIAPLICLNIDDYSAWG